MRLPELPYKMAPKQSEIIQMRGINYSDNFKDGALSDCKNISSRRYPHITTRRGREKLTAYSNATALTSWGELVVVMGGHLYYDGVDRGTVIDGPKQFAVVNTKLVIWPDKKYLDMESMTIKPLSATSTGTGATFTTNTITIAWAGADLTTMFTAGDCITISGCTAQTGNNKTSAVAVKELTATTLTFADDTFTAATETASITFERKVPDMDYICESENRLWGCSNEERCIYASALGDPTNFNTFAGVATDSYALAVGSEGDFTGCAKLSSSVLFYKNNTLHKVLGGYPAEYELYSYEIEGVMSGCSKSIQVINETLLYMSAHGVFAYSGGSNNFISDVLGRHEYTDAVAGNDGDSYYLSAREGTTWHLFVYDLKNGIWIHEDNTHCVDFTRIGKDAYYLDSAGDVYKLDSGAESDSIEWLAQFTPFYETVQGRKRYSKILLRVELPAGSWMKAEVRPDNGKWLEVGKIIGNNTTTTPMMIPINRCDKFEIRLSGEGQATILNMARQFTVGGDA